MRMRLMTENLQKLPLGDSDFSKLRNREAVYVDKTDLIYKLVTENSDKIIFTRPRRFGKSLLVSTLETLFKYGVFEYKYARMGEDSQALLDIAARQIIGRRYGCTPHQQKILRVAAVFSEADRRIACWRQVD